MKKAKDFNTFMYDHTLHRGEKNILDCFKINNIQRIIMPIKASMLISAIMKEK